MINCCSTSNAAILAFRATAQVPLGTTPPPITNSSIGTTFDSTPIAPSQTWNPSLEYRTHILDSLNDMTAKLSSLQPGESMYMGRPMMQRLFKTAAAQRLAPELLNQLSNARFMIVDDSSIADGADASYNGESGIVEVPKSLIAKLLAAATNTAQIHLDHVDGGISDVELGDKLSVQTDRHSAGTGLALLAHEAMHAVQDSSGTLVESLTYIESITDEQTALREYIRLVELPAQRVQEQVQLQLRQPPLEGSFMTMSESGEAYSDDAAVDNILREHGDEILAMLQQTSGFEDLPGFKFPGFKFPGFKFPGFKFPGQLIQ